MENLKDSNNNSDGVILDPLVLESLQIKYKNYFDNHNKRKEEKFGDLFNCYLTPEMELIPYFKNLELREDLLQNKTVLDIGASSHFFDDYCKQKYNSKVVALDVTIESIGKDHDIAVVADARMLPFSENSFDLVISHASMPHILVPHTDENWNFIPLEGEVRQNTVNDVLSVFQEAYRVTKKGGQIRMSTFSEKQQLAENVAWGHSGIKGELKTGEFVSISRDSSLQQMLDRINLIKEALSIFEKESGAHCIFKDETDNGLIIIVKPLI